MKPPNSRERQMMQQLRGVGWVKAFELADNPRVVANLADGQRYDVSPHIPGQAMKTPVNIGPKA